MKNYISINGKQTELTDEQLKQLGIIVNNKPKWEDFGDVEGFSLLVKPDYIRAFKRYVKSSSTESKVIFPTEAEAKACLALSQLCQWRDKYNSGWKPDWTDNSYKCVIYFNNCEIITNFMTTCQSVLAFKTEEIRDKFLEDFSELIMEAAPLL